MAQTMVFTCDICKQSKSKEDLAKIEVTSKGIRIRDCSSYEPLKIDICSDCLKKKGFNVEDAETASENCKIAEKNKKTLEDKLFEILEDMGVAFNE